MNILAFIYFCITSLRNWLYDKKILKINKIEDVFVICIGNITVGGTGKTPAVQYFAKRLSQEGRKVAVVSRGYRGKRKTEPLIVSDGKNILVTSRESGDEPYSHALNLKVPVIVGKNRYEACRLAKKLLMWTQLFLTMVFSTENFSETGMLFWLMLPILLEEKHFFQRGL